MLKLLVAVLLWLLLLARFTRAAACGGGAEAEEGVLFGCQLEPGDAFPDLPAAAAGTHAHTHRVWVDSLKPRPFAFIHHRYCPSSHTHGARVCVVAFRV